MQFQPFTIGRYEFVEFLGRGGMAEVYRVRLTGPQGFQKEFAIKRVLPGFITDPDVVRMFEAEARLTSLLNHANIVQVFEFIKSGSNYFLVMEFIDGKNLASLFHLLRAAGKSIPLPIALYIAQKICEGLTYAHTKKDPDTKAPLNIIHRDISPHNIMLSLEGGVKIVDFGIAKAKNSVSETQTGTTKGKLAYMSPEQAMGNPIDSRSDIFSTTSLLYELLTNRKLFDGENEMQIIRKVQDCKIPSLTETMSEFPPELQSLLAKGLAPIPETRFQSILEMQKHLQSYVHKHFPDMDQHQLAKWLAETVKGIEKSNRTETLEITPLSVSEENLMKDGFAKLEEHLYTQISLDKPKRRPERSSNSDPTHWGAIVLGFAATAIFAGAMGIFFMQKSATRELAKSVPPPQSPKVVLPSPTLVPTTVTKIVPTPTPSPSPATLPKAEIPVPVPVVKRVPTPTSRPVAKRKTDSPPLQPEAPSEFERLGASLPQNASNSPSLRAKTLYEQGMDAFRAGRFERARVYFNQSRTLKANYLPAWFYEIKSLEKLKRLEDAKVIALLLVKAQPEAKGSPILAPYLNP